MVHIIIIDKINDMMVETNVFLNENFLAKYHHIRMNIIEQEHGTKTHMEIV